MGTPEWTPLDSDVAMQVSLSLAQPWGQPQKLKQVKAEENYSQTKQSKKKKKTEYAPQANEGHNNTGKANKHIELFVLTSTQTVT